MLTLAACLTLFAFGISAAQAQDTAEAPSPPFVCGVVSVSADAEGYFHDLCRAMAVAIHGDEGSLDARILSIEEARRAVSEHEVPIAIGMPYELRTDVDVVFGPVVLIRENARYAIAHAPGSQRAGDVAAWLFFALVQAEASEVDSAALEAGLEGDRRDVFSAYEDRLTSQLGLDDDAVRRMIEAAGHHGEIYVRWLGEDPGPNRPVELGGQLYAPPVSDR